MLNLSALVFYALALTSLMFGCGSVTPAGSNGIGDENAMVGSGGAGGKSRIDAGNHADASSGAQGGQGGVSDTTADASQLDPCVWSEVPYVTRPCPDATTAECYYVDSFGTPDGRQEGCSTDGRTCVLQCPAI